jgi:hypothetical protein
MPDFISKVQYKTCEDGEYFDEKPRDLKETLDLIENFPWAREQYADLALTGPSVTIQNDKGEYLRLGIYYGGRFTLHFLDAKSNYFKRQNLTMEAARPAVSQFFEASFTPEGFDRIKFEFVKRFFISRKLEYRIHFWRVFLLSFFWIVWFALFVWVFTASLFSPKYAHALLIFPIVFLLYPSWVLFRTFFRFFQLREQYLRISRSNDILFFGENEKGARAYKKSDIEKIIDYEPMGNRTPTSIQIYEVYFVDGSSIRFTNVLMSASTLRGKFSDKWKFPIETKEMYGWKIIRSL